MHTPQVTAVRNSLPAQHRTLPRTAKPCRGCFRQAPKSRQVVQHPVTSTHPGGFTHSADGKQGAQGGLFSFFPVSVTRGPHRGSAEPLSPASRRQSRGREAGGPVPEIFHNAVGKSLLCPTVSSFLLPPSQLSSSPLGCGCKAEAEHHTHAETKSGPSHGSSCSTGGN